MSLRDDLLLLETFESFLVPSFFGQAERLCDIRRPLHLTGRYTHLPHNTRHEASPSTKLQKHNA